MKIKLVQKLRNFFQAAGPGIITGASDDDPSGILTYLQTGTILGFRGLWLALLSLPFMYGVQEMCARLGLVTGQGLFRLLRQHYSRWLTSLVALVAVLVITINIGADLLAIGVVVEHLAGGLRVLWLPLAGLLVLVVTVWFSYARIARILKWLTFSLFFYVAATFYLNIDWQQALAATIIPSFDFSRSSIMLTVAVLGATISPYLFFWQTSEEVEDRDEHVRQRRLKRFIVTKHELKQLKEDTFLGMLLSNVIMWFIIAGAAQFSSLFGVAEITNFDQAAMVLEPLLGRQAYFIFSLGIIGTGLLAIPVLAGSVGYILAEQFSWQEGINKKFSEARSFYLAIIAAILVGTVLTLFGFDPVQLLIYTAVAYSLITPPIIYLILRLANNCHLMKKRTNNYFNNFLGYGAFLLMALAAASYLLFGLVD